MKPRRECRRIVPVVPNPVREEIYRADLLRRVRLRECDRRLYSIHIYTYRWYDAMRHKQGHIECKS